MLSIFHLPPSTKIVSQRHIEIAGSRLSVQNSFHLVAHHLGYEHTKKWCFKITNNQWDRTVPFPQPIANP